MSAPPPTAPTLCAARGCAAPATARCSSCLGAFYCGAVCQRRDWAAHKAPCALAAGLRAQVTPDALAFDSRLSQWRAEAATAGAAGASAQVNLGISYMTGAGVAKDPVEGARWFARAADNGDVGATVHLGVCCGLGDGVAVDLPRAFRLYARAAAAGNAEAMRRLALCHSGGLGTARDLAAAAAWNRRAADAGDMHGAYNLALAYDAGKGVVKSVAEARRWYRRAAELGHADALYNLAVSIGKGAGDDDIEALCEATQLMARAVDAGSELAKAFRRASEERDAEDEADDGDD